MELGPAFASLEPVRQKVNVINGLHHPGGIMGSHARGAAAILSGSKPKTGREILAGQSLDQLMARKLGQETALSSLVLACERPVSGFHESGNSMLYASHVSWSSPTSPVPSELRPALAFDSLFAKGGSQSQLSVLDHVLGQLNDVSRKVSQTDRAKIDEYATSVREVEQRLEKLQNQDQDENAFANIQSQRPPEGVPTRLDEHARLMCDIVALAFQTDRTRIATLLLTNDLSGQSYPHLGLRSDHHSFSHSWKNPEFAAITRFWVEQYGYLLGKLDSMPEGEGTVLDNSCIMLANEQWIAHSAPKIPLVMGGGLGGTLKTGRALDFEKSENREMSSLYLSLLDRMGVPTAEFGGATEQLSEI